MGGTETKMLVRATLLSIAAAESVQAMKITAVRLRKLRGTMPTSEPFWEERLVRPIDI
jgi:hypothetical protein